ISKDTHEIARTLIHLGIVEEQINKHDLQRDLMECLDHYYGIPLNRLNISKLINELIALIRTNKINLPQDIVIIGRTLAISEAVGRYIYPQFNMSELLVPFVKKGFFNKSNPFIRYRSLIRTVEDSFDLLKSLPDNLNSILYKVRMDKIKINFQHNGLEEFSREIDRSSNRLSFAIIIAALVIGSSLIIHLRKGPLLWSYPIMGIAGFSFATILGIWLLIGIIRSGKL
ncbi:MAG: hypothetical protein P4L45_08640, partial [Ignavibacteriaceae bacterium]|nr:hypothetical protein [Ignavibacteriaceae bacterium]